MTSNEFAIRVKECEAILRERAPVKTGNLRYNAIKLEMPDANTAILYVDEDIAPYMPYTNEKWEKRPSRNPNEGWFDEAVQVIIQFIATYTGGTLS